MTYQSVKRSLMNIDNISYSLMTGSQVQTNDNDLPQKWHKKYHECNFLGNQVTTN